MISTSRILICMDDSFCANILPLIDTEAAQQNATRADVIRDILYNAYYHRPEPRSPAQIEYDAKTEQKYNLEGYKDETMIAYPCLWICVEPRFRDLYMMDVTADLEDVSQPDKTMLENYWRLSREALQAHFFRKAARTFEAL